MDLFEYQAEENKRSSSPLAARMRPKSLEEFYGQEHIVGKDKLLYRAIKADKLSSLIFYGPPGVGKTTLASIIAENTKSVFVKINATTAGKKEIVEAVENAVTTLGGYGKRTILFIDEIHRFNKAQQDTLLPYVEDGTIIIIGATTENPYFEVNNALISRSLIFELKPLSNEDIKQVLNRALTDKERGYGNFKIKIEQNALDFISDVSSGDSRVALNALELAFLTTEPSDDGYIHIDLSVASECIQKRVLNYDADGDNHYDTISAFIKSMRGSDPDAAVYYLAKMLYSGEDPKFIARRMIICASEDVGNADPVALMVATSAMEAVTYIGLPECRINMAQAAAYIACAPKSNAVVCAIDEAMKDVGSVKTSGVPNHLRDRHYSGAVKMGHGEGYKYAHDYKNNYVKQQYLPDELVGKKYYRPTDNGKEADIKRWLKFLKEEEDA
ncbi:MAG TPA: replication-associated recombination protein RarA [Lachnospiraceae bacterium]|nr:replication-associated recombination protein RarA [Lachnospiraceae bacterium]